MSSWRRGLRHPSPPGKGSGHSGPDRAGHPRPADAAIATGLSDSREATSMRGGHLPRRKPTHATGTVDSENLSPGVKPNTPRIAWPHVSFEKRNQLQAVGFEPIVTSVKKVTSAPRRFHTRLTAVTMAEVKLAVETPRERIDRLMRVAVTEAAEQHSALISPA